MTRDARRSDVPEASQFKVVGAATLPLSDGQFVTATWPLVEANVDEVGVRVAVRINEHKIKFWFFRLLAPRSWRDASCAFAWAELKRVRRGPRGMWMYGHDGRRCRFVARRGAQVDAIENVVVSHGIPVETVSTRELYFRSSQ